MGGAAAGGIANGILFFMFLIASVILGLYAGAYAAHVFLVTVDGTASGYDEVTWPDEPYHDWVWKLFYLAWLVTLYAVPLVFYARYQASTQPTAAAALSHAVIAFAVTAWLLFPLTMLSSMGGPSRWLVFYPPALRRAAKGGGSMVVFYLLSGPVLALAAVSVAAMTFLGPFPSAIAGGVGLAAALLIYGRLFGRLALALGQVDGGVKVKARPRFRPSPLVEAAARDPMARGGRPHFVQPEDLPPTSAPDPEARVGYNVRLDDPVEAPRATTRSVDPPEGPYELSDGPADLRRDRGPIPDEWLNPRPYEMELAGRGKKPARPKHPWAGGIFTFPFRKANHTVFVWLAVLLAVLGVFVRLAAQFLPA
jgi:hypothetical protein